MGSLRFDLANVVTNRAQKQVVSATVGARNGCDSLTPLILYGNLA
jgi:hypothetical protein